MSNRTLLTIATGKAIYVDLAMNLARSFFLWNPNTSIKFKLITDQPDRIPIDLFQRMELRTVKPNEFGSGFSPKLHLDRFIEDGQTIFIDSDCLIFGKLHSVFERFKGMPVSVIGSYISEGEWFGDIQMICKKFNIPHLPKFNGGVYYLEKGDIAERVYQNARELEKRYDEIGFIRLRNNPNDEVLMALSMQLEGLKPLHDDATIMSDPLSCPGKYNINIITGNTLMINPALPNKTHQAWYPFEKVSPIIIHFLGAHTADYQYKTETAKLKLLLQNNYNIWYGLKILFCIEYSDRLKTAFKYLLRPIYHFLFGIRKIKVSDRI